MNRITNTNYLMYSARFCLQMGENGINKSYYVFIKLTVEKIHDLYSIISYIKI